MRSDPIQSDPTIRNQTRPDQTLAVIRKLKSMSGPLNSVMFFQVLFYELGRERLGLAKCLQAILLTLPPPSPLSLSLSLLPRPPLNDTVRELLSFYEFPGDDIAIVKGSALAAATGGDPKLGKDAILALMDAVEKSIPTPKRETEKPFLMPVEDTFSIAGRGTVVTGRVEQGKIKVGDDLEIVGLTATQKSTCTGGSRSLLLLLLIASCRRKQAKKNLQRNLRFCNRALFVVILIVSGRRIWTRVR